MYVRNVGQLYCPPYIDVESQQYCAELREYDALLARLKHLWWNMFSDPRLS
jgi:hypothetical protein